MGNLQAEKVRAQEYCTVIFLVEKPIVSVVGLGMTSMEGFNFKGSHLPEANRPIRDTSVIKGAIIYGDGGGSLR
jgi:hypothetical protein